MNRLELYDTMITKQSVLCVGLDPDMAKLPKPIEKSNKGIVAFCKAIIEATADSCIAYKPNLAFFEALGPEGWYVLEEVMSFVPKGIFTIADAKRGDIGNTSKMYAKAFFEHFNFDAVTVTPYMGEDSVKPFLEFEDKWVILLGLTSNKGSADFQKVQSAEGQKLYESVLMKGMEWGSPDNLMFVIGATHGADLAHVRKLVPDHFFLVPGVGAQGGDAATVIQHGKNNAGGLLINASRSILYASDGEDFAEAARVEVSKLNSEMKSLFV